MEHPRNLHAVVADGQPLTRYAIASVLRSHPAVERCVEAQSVPEARQLCLDSKPDLLVLDLALPRGNPLEFIREVRRAKSAGHIFAISDDEHPMCIQRAFRAGAQACLSKRGESAELGLAIEAMAAGKPYAGSRVTDRLLGALSGSAGCPAATAGLELLSDREWHVFRLIGQRMGTAAIARETGVSVKSIETYQSRLKVKLKLSSAQELHRCAESWEATHEGR